MGTIRFHFDTDLASQLRDAVNDRQNLSIKKEHTQKNNRTKITYLAWDRICAIMDRLEDTMSYINQIELGKCINNRSAFDFYEFINCASVIIDCIKTMGQIFGVDIQLLDCITKSQEIFGQKYDEDGTDGLFFEYIRSLCVVHPLFTNRQKLYLNSNKFHCCPFVVWNGVRGRFSKGDLTAFVYTSENSSGTKMIPLYVEEFEKYLEKWVNFIPVVIDAKNTYADNMYDKFRKSVLKELSHFNDEIEYISYLSDEYCKRFGDEYEYIFTGFIRAFKIELTDERNQEKLELYKSSVLYSLTFLRNSMQSMCFEGYENTGLKYTEDWIETDLIHELGCISTYNTSFSSFSYQLGKLCYLEHRDLYDIYDREYARMLLNEVKDLINKYVFFSNEEFDDEVVVLVNLALYLDSLNCKTILNKNIPNEKKYREKLLEDSELTELYKKEERTVNDNNGVDIEDLLRQYGVE